MKLESVMLCITGSLSKFWFSFINYETHMICVFYFHLWSGTDDWRVIGRQLLLGRVVNHGCWTFPEKVATCLLLPWAEPWELDLLANSCPVFLQCKINVTLLFNLHASNMLCFLVNKYARNSNLAEFALFFIFLFLSRDLLFLQTDLKKANI